MQPAAPDGTVRRRAAAYLLAALAVCCVAFLASQGSGAVAPALLAQQSGILPVIDPDAPHARASTGQMYVPQFDPDRSLTVYVCLCAYVRARSCVRVGACALKPVHADSPTTVASPRHGLKLEYGMQSVLVRMSKGSQPAARKVRSAAMYNPAADPDAPSTHDREQLRVATPLGKQMSALSSVEDKMHEELKLKAQVAALSPKYMPQKDTSMMLDLKSSKRGHITFHADAASKDDQKISKQVAAQTTLAESKHEKGLLAREKAKAALLEKKRKLEASSTTGPPEGRPRDRGSAPYSRWWPRTWRTAPAKARLRRTRRQLSRITIT